MTTRMGGIAYDGESVVLSDVSGTAIPATAKYVNGFLVDADGSLCVTSGPVTDALYRGGLAFRSDGALYVTPIEPDTKLTNSGLITNDNGAVWVDSTGSRSTYSQGWPLTSSGALSGAGDPIPSLAYIFTNDTLVPVSGDAEITFTRSGSVATRFNSSGALETIGANQPRFDYDPVTLAARGLLLEEQRANLLLNSLIDGTNLATQSVTVTAQAYTLSFYGTGTITLSGVSTAGPLVGSGAFPTRSTLTFTPTAGSLTLTVSGTVQYAQLEAGSFATSFIPTAGSQVTRTADIATVAVGSWYNASEGALFARYVVSDGFNPASSNAAASLNDGTTTNFMVLRTITASMGANFTVRAGGVDQASALTSGVLGVGADVRAAGVYKANDFALSQNGNAVVTDNSGTVPTVMQITLGSTATPLNNPLNGHIRELRYWPYRLSNAQIQALTA